MNEALKDWAKKEQKNEVLKAIADIKVRLDAMNNYGWVSWEIDEMLEEIESILNRKALIKRLEKEGVELNYLKSIIKETYETIGRKTDDVGDEKSILLKKMMAYLDKVNIPKNYLVISKLKYEQNQKDNGY